MMSKFAIFYIYLFVIGVNSTKDGNNSRHKRSNILDFFPGKLKEIYLFESCTSIKQNLICKIYGDCCEIHDLNPKKMEQLRNITETIPKSILEREAEERFSCLALLNVEKFKTEGIIINTGFNVINWCPKDTKPELKMKCERPHSFERTGPLFDIPAHSIKSKITYANMYCGQCHDDTDFKKYNVYFLNYKIMVPLILDLNTENVEIWIEGRIAQLNLEKLFGLLNYTKLLNFKDNFVIGMSPYYLPYWHECRTNTIYQKCKIPSEYLFMYKDFCRDDYFVNYNNFISSPKDQFCMNKPMMERSCYKKVYSGENFVKPEYYKQEIPGIKFILDSNNINYTYVNFNENN